MYIKKFCFYTCTCYNYFIILIIIIRFDEIFAKQSFLGSQCIPTQKHFGIRKYITDLSTYIQKYVCEPQLPTGVNLCKMYFILVCFTFVCNTLCAVHVHNKASIPREFYTLRITIK